jgi:ribonuclease HII
MASVERKLRAFGFRCIAGTDEVGRGCLAGPVVACAVILECDPMVGINDSKLLTCEERTALCRVIVSCARAIGIGVVEPHVIDRINILNASKLAMQVAVENLSHRPDVLILDAVTVETLEMPQVPLIGGDRRSVSIAAASVVAKCYRDSLMESYHDVYPHYDFVNNRGYGTESHWEALRRHGPSPIHRTSFEGVGAPLLLFEKKSIHGTAAR